GRAAFCGHARRSADVERAGRQPGLRRLARDTRAEGPHAAAERVLGKRAAQGDRSARVENRHRTKFLVRRFRRRRTIPKRPRPGLRGDEGGARGPGVGEVTWNARRRSGNDERRPAMTKFSNYEPKGVIPACLLPFHADLSIDEPSYRKHLRDVTSVRGLSAITINAHASEVAS